MKKVFLAVLCLSLPVFASATNESAPVSETEAMTSQEELVSTEESNAVIPAPLPYCWNIDQTSCSPAGSTQRCTDGIYTDYVCTCRAYTAYPNRYIIWDCPEVR